MEYSGQINISLNLLLQIMDMHRDIEILLNNYLQSDETFHFLPVTAKNSTSYLEK